MTHKIICFVAKNNFILNLYNKKIFLLDKKNNKENTAFFFSNLASEVTPFKILTEKHFLQKMF
jgi:hypothetical protein